MSLRIWVVVLCDCAIGRSIILIFREQIRRRQCRVPTDVGGGFVRLCDLAIDYFGGRDTALPSPLLPDTMINERGNILF